MGKAYYNEIEPFAAQWLRNLIDKGLIAPGDVDTRSIEDVRPEELQQYTQCHFFAGIGIWSLALRNAGVSDDTRVWSGSCPCQPFSSAGKANGFDDERHLWPAFQHLISECRPPAVLGEQVASKDADPWIDLVQNDLEAMGYAVGAVPFPSASVGAPHIRDRLYWVGERVSNTDAQRLDPDACTGLCQDVEHDAQSCCGSVGPGHAVGTRLEGYPRHEHDRCGSGRIITPEDRPVAAPGCTNGFWRDCDWLPFRDGKIRPIESGTFPLVDGNPGIVGRLRAYGNAINAVQAEEFIRAWLACRPV